MLKRFHLFGCADPRSSPQTHPFAGSPESWFATDGLRSRDLRVLDFDFFVDWRKGTIARSIIIKRGLAPGTPAGCLDEETLDDAAHNCDGADYLEGMSLFSSLNGFEARYIAWDDTIDWQSVGVPCVTSARLVDGHLQGIGFFDLPTLMRRIQDLSGGPVKVGPKKLKYATSNLECFLARTDAAWPGDVDAILVGSDGHPVAILEYKKHNKTSAISGQTFMRYYGSADRRKYDRIALLRDRINPKLPIVVVHYPTHSALSEIKFEQIVGQARGLEADRSLITNLPRTSSDVSHLIDRLLDFL